MPNVVQKHFPADTDLSKHTFLNDPKVDAELYAYLQALSIFDADSGENRVYKNKMPTRKYLAETVFEYGSRNTLTAHFNYLKEQGYIVEHPDYYVLPNKETIYFKIPLELINFFIDVVKYPVVKTYIYLGQRYKYRPGTYVFTEKEIAEHLGISYTHQHKKIANYLKALEKFGLITIARFYEGQVPMMRLVKFSTTISL